MRCHHEAKLGLLHMLLLDMTQDLTFKEGELPPEVKAFFDSANKSLLMTAAVLEQIGTIHRAYAHRHEEGHEAESALFTDELVQSVIVHLNQFLKQNGSALPPVDPTGNTGPIN